MKEFGRSSTADEHATQFAHWPRWLIGGLATLLVMVLLFLFYGPTDNWSWDPSFYYAQLRSPLVDHDLDFWDETNTGEYQLAPTERGLQGSSWPVGPAVLWSPFFLAVHLPLLLLFPGRANGLTFPYIGAVSFGSALFGVLALVVIYRILRLFGGRRESLLVTAAVLLATPLAFYIFRQPITAHTTALFVSALLVYAYLLLERGELDFKYSGFTLGVLLGLNVLTRWAGVLQVVFLASYFLLCLRKSRREAGPPVRPLRPVLGQALLAVVFFGLTISPQLVMWAGLYGTPFAAPQGAASFVDSLLPINLLNIFFHLNRGLLYWAPFVLLGLIGLWLVPERRFKWTALIFIGLNFLLIGYRVDWYSGRLYNQRYILEMLPLVAVGCLAIWQRVRSYPALRTGLGALAVLMIVHQLVLVYAWEHSPEPGWIPIYAYAEVRPISLRVHWDSFIRLLQDPALWFVPRPFVGLDRQTMVVNLLNDQSSLRTLALPLIALLLSPLVVAGVVFGNRLLRRRSLAGWPVLVLLSGCLLVLALLWAVYLLQFV